MRHLAVRLVGHMQVTGALDPSTRGGLRYPANTTGLTGRGSVAPVARQLAEGTSTTRASPCTRTA